MTKMSANIDNMFNEFKHYYFQQKAKATQETKRLSQENHRLINEVFFLKTTNKHLEQNLKLKTDRVEDLEECNKMLNENVVKLNKCLIVKVKTIKDLVKKHSIHNENQQKLQLELKRNEQLLERFQNRCKLLVENRMRLTEEKNRLINILNEEMKNIRETVAKKQQIINEMKSFSDHLKSKLDFQIESNYKQLSIHKNEVLKMKLSFNSQFTSLKKQRQYFKRYNEINKRKYSNSINEKICRENITTFHKFVKNHMKKAFDDYIEKMLKERENCESNANNEMKGTLIDLIRDNVRQREKMGIKVNEILKKRHLNKVQCPECDRSFLYSKCYRRHMNETHAVLIKD